MADNDQAPQGQNQQLPQAAPAAGNGDQQQPAPAAAQPRVAEELRVEPRRDDRPRGEQRPQQQTQPPRNDDRREQEPHEPMGIPPNFRTAAPVASNDGSKVRNILFGIAAVIAVFVFGVWALSGGSNPDYADSTAPKGAIERVVAAAKVVRLTAAQQAAVAKNLFASTVNAREPGVGYSHQVQTADTPPRTGCVKVEKTSRDGYGYSLWQCPKLAKN